MTETKIEISKFGKDHWSTFAYIECRCVDNKGVPDRRHMRTDVDLHPGLAGCDPMSYRPPGKYPTRLKDGEVAGHDDWSCAEDLEREGLIEIGGTGINPVFKMTEKGEALAAKLRAHKAAGGTFGNFSHE
jgi:hypothetical protein